jgi:1-acyl-sn-glycerol-3-phosphate acyltransferase
MTPNPMTWSWPTIALALAAAGAVGLAAFVAFLPWVVQPFLRLALKFHYHLDVVGRDNVPKTGPVLLVSNHVTWFDGFFLAATIPRRGTALVNAGVFGWPVVGYLAKRSGLLSIPYTGPKAQRAAIATARKALDDGRLLGIFPEGQLTRNGFTGAFHRGLEVILADRERVPVVPVFIDNAWGSVASYAGGGCFRRLPETWRRRVVIAFGPPIEPPVDVFRTRQAVLAQGVAARARLGTPTRPVEASDPSLPSWNHPDLGLLAASVPDDELGGAKQVGQKPGTVGHAVPGLALRAVGDDGASVGAGEGGRLEVLMPGRAGWLDTGRRGRVDRDGFVTLAADAG